MKSWKNCLSDTQLGEYKDFVGTRDEQVRSFLEFDPQRADQPRSKATNGHSNDDRSALFGLPVAVKDNIAVDGFHLTCGSRMLRDFVSPYDATAVSRLRAVGAQIVGKTNLDEFGMGSSTDTSALAITNNPWDLERVAGGSSGGSAAAVAAGLVPLALGSDTGGSVRQPAAFCGVYGLKPTYGTVSRFGLVAYASSLEVIGILSKDIDLIDECFKTIRGIDEHDHSSIEQASTVDSAAQTIGFIDSSELDLSDAVRTAYEAVITELGACGLKTVPVRLDLLQYAVPVYYTIATAEASANLARYNGIRYGHRTEFAEDPDQLMKKSRSEGFGREVKLRILLGTYVLRSGFQDRYYLRAQKIRTAIRNEFVSAFSKVDSIVMPTFPTTAFRHGDQELNPFQQKLADRFTTAANLAGLPALAIPAGCTDAGLPVGVQFMGPAFAEDRLFGIAKALQSRFPCGSPAGFPDQYSFAGSALNG